MNNLQEKIIKKAKSMGVTKIGFANLSGYLPDEFSHLQTGISIAIRLSDQIMNDVVDIPTHTYYHHYRTVNFLIDQITLSITMMLQEEGYLAMAVPASQTVKSENERLKGIFPHKTAATQGGIGWIGKNACLVTEEFGPRVRLGTVLTNMIAEYDAPVTESKCGTCNICMKLCPSLAIKGVNWNIKLKREDIYDAHACSTHMSQYYKEIGRGSVCGICLSRCPRGTKVIKK
ncbi:hypothetical protein CLPU_16c00050 [Gottschalkia purinilytica]|uniref:4Fe-4S ferredoxin-type domain-containing protein n=1 Tax=Gottschalkia purinilytica TaxID=1503 RepID=A0A0L0W7M9_GOTPU|nr:4Fe-4S double cluster binding domain-containing protein [Gottschalkia purinilytica]KNF07452.1 hypothetical protein CLPU_16c00050 [Gottschalkia purinilytica]